MPESRDASAPDRPPPIGRYEVIRLLGEGSMGRVLLVRDPVLDRHVALKHLRPDLGLPTDVREGLLRRMQHEARAAGRVTHPNLVVLHDMGEDEGVGVFLVFEFIDGPTLKERLVAGGRLRATEAAKLARELGGALAVAHEAGVLHRDVKPENVMLAKTGGKIADFGIARVPDSTLTHRGGLMGTPAYSAPETFRGGRHSAASDQFSLAATLYEAVSGVRAFPGDDAVTVAGRIANGPPPAFASSFGLPARVDDVFQRALARSPEQRFDDCAAFGDALADALLLSASADRTDVTVVSAPSVVSVDPPRQRKVGQVAVGGIVVVGTAGLLALAALRDDPRDVPPVSMASSAPSVPHPVHRPGASVPPRAARPHVEPVAATDAGAPVPSASASAAPSASPAPSADRP